MVDCVYKESVVDGKKYLQIWSKASSEKKGEYLGTIGKAEKALKLLVRLKDLSELTKIQGEKLTKISTENQELLTKLESLSKR